MAYEKGGRASKYGNRFEYNWVICKLLDVIEEKIDAIQYEAIGDDEQGIDLWIFHKNGSREAQQCKGRNGNKEYWDYGSVNSNGIWGKWRFQLERSETISVSLVTPLNFVLLEDIARRARNNDSDAEGFYKYQIMESGPELIQLFENVCKSIQIDLNSITGKRQALDYFSRIYVRQTPDSELKMDILNRMHFLFLGDPQIIYGILLDYVFNEDILGKKINYVMIDSLLKNKNIEYRNLAHDERLWPAIQRLNDEFDQSFKPLSVGLIEREAVDKCFKFLLMGKSGILYGNAGMGKSGCMEGFIRRLKTAQIPYLAIKLDRRVPQDNPDAWANTMGMPVAISQCINAISEGHAVIILDQLDALRWTQAHSGDALMICLQIIKDIQKINKERVNPISLLFVCRTYDLENDSGIKNLFSDKDEWFKVEVGPLKDSELQKIVGAKYDSLSTRTKKLLRIPNNLYIWEKLSKNGAYENIGATYQLVKAWWKEITLNCNKKNLRSDKLEEIRDSIVKFCNEKGRMSVPKIILHMPADYEEFLISSGFIVAEQSSIAFVHQSILDCFLAEEMLSRYMLQEDIKSIIGKKSDQIPARRYQTQIFLQQLAECDLNDFLVAGKTMLLAQDIRYSFKYVFIEVLSQLEMKDDVIVEFVLELLTDPKWKMDVVMSFIRGSDFYVHLLLERGILNSWMQDSEMQSVVIDLFYTIHNSFEFRDKEFVETYILGKADVEKWKLLFPSELSQDTDAFFELRLIVYEKYPKLMDVYLDVEELMNICEKRIIRLLALMLKKNAWEETINSFDAHDAKKVMDVSEYGFVIESLLPLFPNVLDCDVSGEWSGQLSLHNGLERLCVALVKAAAKKCATVDPNQFMEYFQFAFRKGHPLYNEIILEGMCGLGDQYSDFVLDYLSQNNFINAFESTSNNGNRLLLAKKLISRHTKTCSDKAFADFENSVVKYVSPRAKKILEDKIKTNHERRNKHEELSYWTFWGDLQQEIIPSIFQERRSKKTDDVYKVLFRRDERFHSIYDYGYAERIYSTVSAIEGKKISIKSWGGIITNPNIRSELKIKCDAKSGICKEISLYEFISSFRQFVMEHPTEISEYICNNGIMPCEKFGDAYFEGLYMCESLKSIDENLLVQAIRGIGYNYESKRASSIAGIIKKRQPKKQKEYFLRVLWDIIDNYSRQKDEEYTIKLGDDKEGKTIKSIECDAINSVRGGAVLALQPFAAENKDFLNVYKSKLEVLCHEKNLKTQYCMLHVLLAVSRYDNEWALRMILSIFKSDYRLVGFVSSRDILCYCYDNNSDFINELLLFSYHSSDERLNELAGFSMVEFFMTKNSFTNIFDLYLSAGKVIRKAMLESIVRFFGMEEYRDRALVLLEKIILVENDNENEFLWGKLFCNKMVNSEEHSELIRNILSRHSQRYVISHFSEYVLGERKVKEYSDIILEACENILVKQKDKSYFWMVDRDILRLIFSLYDETANSSNPQNVTIANKCLDLWDIMYEKNIGMARRLTEKLLD